VQKLEKVIERWTFQGTQTGPFFNIPPSGSKVTYPIITIYRIEDGRIAEDWHVFHALVWYSAPSTPCIPATGTS
jgi:predicted ester cyclase